MVYTVTNIQQKTSTTGKNYQVADLMDMNGQVFEAVSSWNGDFKSEGLTLDGTIESKEFNGKTYFNFKGQSSITPGGKTGQMVKTMEKKAEMISHAQDRKEEAIQHAGSITNATNLVIALLSAGVIPSMASETEIKTKVREYIVWYKELYTNPQSVAPF